MTRDQMLGTKRARDQMILRPNNPTTIRPPDQMTMRPNDMRLNDPRPDRAFRFWKENFNPRPNGQSTNSMLCYLHLQNTTFRVIMNFSKHRKLIEIDVEIAT
jgi:hypothetical protein